MGVREVLGLGKSKVENRINKNIKKAKRDKKVEDQLIADIIGQIEVPKEILQNPEGLLTLKDNIRNLITTYQNVAIQNRQLIGQNSNSSNETVTACIETNNVKGKALGEVVCISILGTSGETAQIAVLSTDDEKLLIDKFYKDREFGHCSRYFDSYNNFVYNSDGVRVFSFPGIVSILNEKCENKDEILELINRIKVAGVSEKYDTIQDINREIRKANKGIETNRMIILSNILELYGIDDKIDSSHPIKQMLESQIEQAINNGGQIQLTNEGISLNLGDKGKIANNDGIVTIEKVLEDKTLKNNHERFANRVSQRMEIEMESGIVHYFRADKDTVTYVRTAYDRDGEVIEKDEVTQPGSVNVIGLYIQADTLKRNIKKAGSFEAYRKIQEQNKPIAQSHELIGNDEHDEH